VLGVGAVEAPVRSRVVRPERRAQPVRHRLAVELEEVAAQTAVREPDADELPLLGGVGRKPAPSRRWVARLRDAVGLGHEPVGSRRGQ